MASSVAQLRGRCLQERDEARDLIEELLNQLLPSVRSQTRYSQGAQSAMIRARQLLARMKATDGTEG